MGIIVLYCLENRLADLLLLENLLLYAIFTLQTPNFIILLDDLNTIYEPNFPLDTRSYSLKALQKVSISALDLQHLPHFSLQTNRRLLYYS
jgi:hypothetical protein